jgi:hypothetical protein
MRQSIPLMSDGSLVAIAAQGDAGWYLIAPDARLEDLDRANFQDVAAAERAARGMLRRQQPQPQNDWRR